MPTYTFATGVPNIVPAVYSTDDTETDLNTEETVTASNGVLSLTLDVGDYYAEWTSQGDTHTTGGAVANPAGVQSLGEVESGGSSQFANRLIVETIANIVVTPAASSPDVLAANLNVLTTVGTDLAVEAQTLNGRPGIAAITSVAGGDFYAQLFIDAWMTAVDGGSTVTRRLWTGLYPSAGDSGNWVGLDSTIPIGSNDAFDAPLGVFPGVAPGGNVLNMKNACSGIDLTGTDSVSVYLKLMVWSA